MARSHRMKSAQAAAKKWAAGVQNARQSYTDGIQAVQDSPCVAAANRADEWQRKLALPETKAKFVSRLNAISVEEWKRRTLLNGPDKYVNGVNKGAPKFKAFMDAFIPYLAEGVANLPERGTFEQNMQRANQMARWNSMFRGQQGGGVMQRMNLVP